MSLIFMFITVSQSRTATTLSSYLLSSIVYLSRKVPKIARKIMCLIKQFRVDIAASDGISDDAIVSICNLQPIVFVQKIDK